MRVYTRFNPSICVFLHTAHKLFMLLSFNGKHAVNFYITIQEYD